MLPSRTSKFRRSTLWFNIGIGCVAAFALLIARTEESTRPSNTALAAGLELTEPVNVTVIVPGVTLQPPQPTSTSRPPDPTATPQPQQPTATPQPPQPTSTPQPPQPTATPKPQQPTATPQPQQPTATPQPPQPTATPQPPQLTATPLPQQPTATPQPQQPTATTKPQNPTVTPTARPEGPTNTPGPIAPTATAQAQTTLVPSPAPTQLVSPSATPGDEPTRVVSTAVPKTPTSQPSATNPPNNTPVAKPTQAASPVATSVVAPTPNTSTGIDSSGNIVTPVAEPTDVSLPATAGAALVYTFLSKQIAPNQYLIAGCVANVGAKAATQIAVTFAIRSASATIIALRTQTDPVLISGKEANITVSELLPGQQKQMEIAVRSDRQLVEDQYVVSVSHGLLLSDSRIQLDCDPQGIQSTAPDLTEARFSVNGEFVTVSEAVEQLETTGVMIAPTAVSTQNIRLSNVTAYSSVLLMAVLVLFVCAALLVGIAAFAERRLNHDYTRS